MFCFFEPNNYTIIAYIGLNIMHFNFLLQSY